jgi:hypothetical protein
MYFREPGLFIGTRPLIWVKNMNKIFCKKNILKLHLTLNKKKKIIKKLICFLLKTEFFALECLPKPIEGINSSTNLMLAQARTLLKLLKNFLTREEGGLTAPGLLLTMYFGTMLLIFKNLLTPF